MGLGFLSYGVYGKKFGKFVGLGDAGDFLGRV